MISAIMSDSDMENFNDRVKLSFVHSRCEAGAICYCCHLDGLYGSYFLKTDPGATHLSSNVHDKHPLVSIQKAIENGHLWLIFPLNMVKLP